MLVQVLLIQWSTTPLHLLFVYMSTLGSQIPLSALMCFIWFGKWGFPDSSAGKESSCNAGDPGLIPDWGRSPGERVGYPLQHSWTSLVAWMVKNPPAMWETWVGSLVWEDPLEEGMATHSSILAWRIPMDRGTWWATVHEIEKSWTQLSTAQVLVRWEFFICQVRWPRFKICPRITAVNNGWARTWT